MAIAAEDQLAMDETVIVDDIVEYALNRRQDTKDALVEPRKAYRTANDAAKVALERLELPEGRVARVGRFRIERIEKEAHHVEFDVEPKTQLKITLVDDAD